jgi:hypothetical protein
LINQSGKFYFVRSDGVIFVGTISVQANAVSGQFDGYPPADSTFSDGSEYGSGSFSGTISPQTSIAATLQFKTEFGSTSSSGALTLTYDSQYLGIPSLSAISGNWTDPVSGDVISITTAGEVSWQDPTTGCVGNGTVIAESSGGNIYDVQLNYNNCQGAYAALNGGTFTGFATTDSAVSPERAVVGVTGQAAGHPMYALSWNLNRD